MAFVDDEGMGVVRVISRPAFTPVKVVGRQIHMAVGKVLGIMGGPDQQAQDSSGRAQPRQHQEGRARIDRGADQTRHGIGDQPAGVGQGELGRE